MYYGRGNLYRDPAGVRMDPAAVSRGAEARAGLSAHHALRSAAISNAADCARDSFGSLLAEKGRLGTLETSRSYWPAVRSQLSCRAVAVRKFPDVSRSEEPHIRHGLFRLLRSGHVPLRPVSIPARRKHPRPILAGNGNGSRREHNHVASWFCLGRLDAPHAPLNSDGIRYAVNPFTFTLGELAKASNLRRVAPCSRYTVGALLAAPSTCACRKYRRRRVFRSAEARLVNPLGIHPESFVKGRLF
jgi:hypothetical protein